MAERVFVDGHGLCEVWDLPRVAPRRQRRGKYVQESFRHPAKMHVGLCRRIIEEYTRPGETVLDPMAGIGTTLVEAALMGRDAVGVELERPYADTAKRNIELIAGRPTIGPKGRAAVFQGDSKRLSEILLVRADSVVTSPPFADSSGWKAKDYEGFVRVMRQRCKDGLVKGHYSTPEAELEYIRRVQEASRVGPGNISNLPYGDINAIVTSPPYAEAQRGGGIAQRGYDGPKHGKTDLVGRRAYMPENVGESEGNISNMPYGDIDAVVSSPPHADTIHRRERDGVERLLKKYREGKLSGTETRRKVEDWLRKPDRNPGFASCYDPSYTERVDAVATSPPSPKDVAPHTSFRPGHTQDGGGYSRSPENIGNMSGETYLSAMLAVYRECLQVLRPGGRMVLVVRDFVRDGMVKRLDLDTKRLCEFAGFRWAETRLFRLPWKSFWRRQQEEKHPVADPSLLRYEFVMVFQKPEGVPA